MDASRLLNAASLNAACEETSWWRRPAGVREVLQIALPLVVSTVSWTVMTFVDRMLLNKSSSIAMSAAFSSSMVWFAVFCLPLGICSYVNTFVSQYHGDKQPNRIGPAVWQGVWIALAAIPFCLLAIPFAPMIFEWAEHGAEAIRMEVLYFQILCVGGPGMLIAQSLSAFYGGRGKTWVVMLVDTGVVIVNLALDWVLIFGYLGFPKMGIAGAGWATVIAFWLKALIYIPLILQKKHRQEFHTWIGLTLDRPLFRRLLRFGFPSGLQMLLDILGWTVFVLLVGQLGHTEFIATTLAFSVSSVAFMPIWGFGMATSILVGQKLGEDRDDLAARATWTLLGIGMSYMVVISSLYVLTPDLFLSGFFAGSKESPEQQAAAHTMAVNLLCFIAAYNLLDAVLMMFVNALKGAGDTRFILLITVLMAVLLAFFSWLAVVKLKLGIYACWGLVVGWVWVMGTMFFWRFQTGKWRLMRVIESQHTPTLHEQEGPTGTALLASTPTE